MIGVLRLLTRANRREEFALCAQFSASTNGAETSGICTVWALCGKLASRGQPPGMAKEAANAAIRYAFRAQQDPTLQADPATGLRFAMFPDLDRWCSTSEGRGRSSSSSKVLHRPGVLTLARRSPAAND